MHITIRLFVTLAIASCAAAEVAGQDPTASAPPIRVEPAAVKLIHPLRPQSLLVLSAAAEGISLDVTGQATIASKNEQIVRVAQGRWLTPVATGTTEVAVTARGQTITVPVEVQLPAATPPTSFRHDVMPVLSKGGCNMGACHGYSLGKNGFKLSLRGAEPEADFPALTREYAGRRINTLQPAASLIIAKPTGAAPHDGGVRFARDSLLSATLAQWIAEGAQGDLADTHRVESIEMLPRQLVLRPGDKHQVQLVARYTDGTTRDVTRWGVYSVNNPRFAEISEEGLLTAGELGETAVVARYERKFAATGVIVLTPNPQFTPTPPSDHPLDKFVGEKLNRLHITPSGLCTDEEFLRRAYLDLIGLGPQPDEVTAFTSDADPNKRLRVIDELMTRREFVDQWSLKWGDLLQNSRLRLSDPAVYAFREWIRGAVASNMPLDEMARRILTARGGALDDPASAYYLVSKDADDTVQRATQVFCGVRMLCAKCHPHPMENWTQADYYGLYSFFNQLSAKGDPRLPNVGNARTIVLNLPTGYATHPRTGQAQPPRFLGGGEPEVAANSDRREVYARWLTAADNPHFARNLANRLWSYFFHRGVIEPVDDLRSTNPPINPQLLDALTAELVRSKFDARQLMRLIVSSQTYQRSSQANVSNAHDENNFSHFVPRRVPAEALLDTLVQATGVAENFDNSPGGFTAKQLPDAEVQSDFLELFGKPQRAEACECERDAGSNMLQALHMINGKSILGRVSASNGRVAQLVRDKVEDEPAVRELYLWSLARQPQAAELEQAIAHIKSYQEKREAALQDLFWALLNSREFQLIH